MSHRLQPSLLDRLTDDQPSVASEPHERGELSPRMLRQRVRRDLAWLFNTANLATVLDLTQFPNTAASVLNFGLEDLTGRTASSVSAEVESTEQMLQQAICRFEPRLINKSVRVDILNADKPLRYNQLAFNIHAQLWAEPVPLHLALRTELNLETGDALVSELIEAAFS